MLKRINGASALMMESGLHHFYNEYSQFILKIQTESVRRKAHGASDSDVDIEVLRLDQLGRLLKLAFYLWGIALIVFIAERIIFLVIQRQ